MMRTGMACAAVAAAVFCLPAAATAAASAACGGGTVDLARGVDVVHALRAYTGTDGASHVEPFDLKGNTAAFMGGSVKLTQFDLGDPTKAGIVYGFPNIDIPPHPAPYREIFILLSGSSEIRLPGGATYALTPGSVFVADDLGSTGRGGRAGPCGYVALDLQFKTDVPAKP